MKSVDRVLEPAAAVLLGGVLIAQLLSPPLVNLMVLLLWIAVLASPTLRQRLWSLRSHPVVLGTIAVYLVVSLGLLYSMAPYEAARDGWVSWRKLLLLPIAMAVFMGRPAWVDRALAAFTVFCVAAAAVSLLGWGLGQMGSSHAFPAIFLRNHVTQGIAFVMAAAVILAWLVWRSSAMPRMRVLAWLALSVLLLDILLVITGRSAYVLLLVAVAVFIWTGLRRVGMGLWQAGAMALLGLSVAVGILWASPTARERVVLAWTEASQHASASEVTSAGIRVVFWRNSLELIQQAPWLGHGTGSFEAAYTALIADKQGVGATPSGDPHNQYLRWAVEYGLLGLMVFLGWLLVVLRHARHSRHPVLLVLAVLGWCATSLFNSHFSTFSEGHFVVAWMGLLLAPVRQG
jgi:O-antigen ligase